MTDFAQHITICRQQIEQKLGRGKSETWQNQDFEKLSEQILLETGQVLSLSTLKRIWGKVKYNSRPNVTTLDVLAQFVGYEHWRAFENAQAHGGQKGEVKTKRQQKGMYSSRIGLYLLGILACFVLAFWFFQGTEQITQSLQYSNLVFKSQALTLGLPNTVVFEYDARHSNADSVFIQQSWDRSKRQKVDKKGKIHTSTYYIPGYYKAKLILNDSIVKEHDVFIETPGWIGFLDAQPVPIYLTQAEIMRKDEWGFSQDQLRKYKLNTPQPLLFVLANVNKQFSKIDSTHFELEMQLQNTFYSPGQDICQKTFVSILGSNGLVNIPFCKIGCVGEVSLIVGNKIVSGKTNSLAAFGVDFDEKIKLYCRLAKGSLNIFINGKLAFTTADPKIGKLVGVRVAFTGAGEMNKFRVW